MYSNSTKYFQCKKVFVRILTQETMAENNVLLELPNENIEKKLDEIIRSKGLKNYEVEISPGSKKGDNYAGIVYKIKVSGSKENGEEASLNLFCKLPVLKDGFREEDGTHVAFKREIKFYDEIIKEFKAFEIKKLIEEDGFTSYAECFSTSSLTFEEFLIMEDLTKRNFAMFDRFKPIDLKHTTLVMKALGKLHALSFALRDQKPELLEIYGRELPDVVKREEEEWNPLFTNFVGSFLQKSKDKLKFEGIYQEKWEYFHTHFHDFMRNCNNRNLSEPFAVVAHGDCWNNNLMFKYENGSPTEVCLLDWQLCRYSSPILDLMYYIFCSTEKAFRDQHYNTLLKIYHDSLSSYLKELGSDVDELFPYSEFQKELKRVGKYGIIAACVTVPIFLVKEEDAMNFEDMVNNISSTVDKETTAELWVTRVADVLRDIVDLGYL